MIITREQLIQEGVLDFAKNHWGKGLLMAGAVASAKAGIFGPSAKQNTDKFIDTMGDFSDSAITKLKNEYGKDKDGDGVKELPGIGESNNTSNSPTSDAENFNLDSIIQSTSTIQ